MSKFLDRRFCVGLEKRTKEVGHLSRLRQTKHFCHLTIRMYIINVDFHTVNDAANSATESRSVKSLEMVLDNPQLETQLAANFIYSLHEIFGLYISVI